MRLELMYFDYILQSELEVGEGEIRLLPVQRRYKIPRATHYQAIRELIAFDMINRLGADRYSLTPAIVERTLEIALQRGYGP